ncbi:ArsR/SmtB family transcription factor [Shimia sp.]|uniref:ArsR/SmtB family transcription factor n=1 Tax=Shimia sp. TaxID=1954381 RepID=UPI003564E951
MTQLSTAFAALADDTRLRIVERLMADGELPAGALVEHAAISGPAISRHLRVLREAGLISQRAEGNKRYYAVRPQSIQAIARWTLDHRAFWQAGLDRLDTFLAEDAQ